MKDSATYQEIVAEGREQGLEQGRLQAARDFLMDLGSRKLGRTDRKTEKQIDGIKDYERLKKMTERIFDVKSWKELLRD